MYGTVMIAKMKAEPDRIAQVTREWQQRTVPGFISSEALVADDGATLVAVVKFASKEEYQALADAPEQDEWWRTQMMPLLDGEPTWIDGTWQR